MTTCHPSAFPKFMLSSATAIAPHRRTGTDGICASSQHHANNPDSDHEPDYRGIPHAVDVSVDPGVFDPRDYLDVLVHDHRFKYIVANFSGWRGKPNNLPDVIYENGHWQQNGSFKRDHATAPHVHFSFVQAAENSTAVVWSTAPTNGDDDEVTPADIQLIARATANILVAKQKDGTFSGVATEMVKAEVAAALKAAK